MLVSKGVYLDPQYSLFDTLFLKEINFETKGYDNATVRYALPHHFSLNLLSLIFQLTKIY